MGGYGSGNHGSQRPASDGLLFLDIRYMRRAGFFRGEPGNIYSGELNWSCRGKPSGTISVFVRGSAPGYPPQILLKYRVKAWNETEWRDVSERVAIETTPCRYGGERPWFLCPRCDSRRAVLFSVDGRFRCRECHGIAYSSTRETEEDRAARRALELQKRLGGHKHGTIYDPEPRPLGMHRETYRRICDELDELERITMVGFMVRFGQLEKRFKRLTDAPLGDLARLL